MNAIHATFDLSYPLKFDFLPELSKEELSSLSVEEWLESLALCDNYAETFRSSNLFASMERVAAIWDDELTSILDVEKVDLSIK